MIVVGVCSYKSKEINRAVKKVNFCKVYNNCSQNKKWSKWNFTLHREFSICAVTEQKGNFLYPHNHYCPRRTYPKRKHYCRTAERCTEEPPNTERELTIAKPKPSPARNEP